MDKIEKAIARLSSRERSVIKRLLSDVKTNKVEHLDIKKLIGHDDIFRARKGSARVIYRITARGVFILAIERRSEKTYRKF
ncbi:MAG: hypothetical protein A3A33_00300 [Candidatus Yanofskybacteria bacterium RIFCSPLOWO2_01_FULL_49_25]|uniref:Plasmid stabilization protein n=1 Tax=Candidatus Yanofskybacteria bacterium RIFCSPLOWO2_01_FULL_49_25 TaxID=1802701 RepID=A0A1F8GUX0_9BACT|nr:MAG: hypothetical protein A3A33_00300 [Candidatus Yanofskybacteria bacterium RIFCSPLOWO2_01_FULL_49_25]